MGWALALTLILALVACAAVVSSKQSDLGSFFKKVSPEQHQAAVKAEAQAAQAARLNKELAAAEEGGAGSAQGAGWKQHRPHNARRDKKARAQKAGAAAAAAAGAAAGSGDGGGSAEKEPDLNSDEEEFNSDEEEFILDQGGRKRRVKRIVSCQDGRGTMHIGSRYRKWSTHQVRASLLLCTQRRVR